MTAFLRRHMLPAVVLACLTFFTYGEIRNYFFTDVDTFSLIQDGRWNTFSDLIGHFNRELMAGRMVNAVFYRPLTSVTLGAEHHLFGANPRGYHLVDLTLLWLTSVLLLAIARQIWAGKRATAIGFLAAVLFILHPLQLDAVPAIARLGDLLFTFFCLLALHCALNSRRAVAGSTRRVAAAALSVGFACLAFLSKEPGILTSAIVALAVFVFSDEATPARRLRRTLLVVAPYLVVIGALFLWRSHVLTGVGGYVDRHGTFTNITVSSLTVKLTILGHFDALFFCGLTDSLDLYGASFLAEHNAVIYPLFLILVAVLVALVARSGWRVVTLSYHAGEETALTDQRAAWLFGGLLGLYFLLLAVTSFSPRYLYFSLTGFAFLLAIAAIRTYERIAARQAASRQLAMVAIVLAVVYWHSPAWHKERLRRWQTSGEVARTILTDLERVERSGAARHVFLLNLPHSIIVGHSTYTPEVPNNQLLLDHSLLDYLQLRGLQPEVNAPEIVVLNYLLMTGPPESLRVTSEFVTANALQVTVAQGGAPSRYPWPEIRGRRKYEELYRLVSGVRLAEKEPPGGWPNTITIQLLPAALADPERVFYAYEGGGLREVRQKGHP